MPRPAVLSVITGGGKWVEITVPADSLYQHLLLTAEKKFWRCVESGDRQTRTAFLQHENAKVELKSLMPEDAKEAIGHGLRAKRSKSGAVSFDLLEMEAGRAAL
jgi:hypothetical protein